MHVSAILRVACCVIFMVALVGLGSQALSQDTDAGRANFMAYCAECHGADGKGNGPQGAKLKTKPADLTLLAKKNKGAYNPGPIFQIIDGRQPGSRAHLSGEMPIWGCRHQVSTLTMRRRMPRHQRYLPPPVTHKSDEDTTIGSLADVSCDPEARVEERILSIVGYLSRIQR